MTDLKEPLNLFTETFQGSSGQEVEVLLGFKEKNKSAFKVDETITSMKLSLKIGEKRRAYTVNDENLEMKIHLSITKTDL